MPLLGRETELSPQSIFELSQDHQPWWVARTRSRQEKSLARYLLPLAVPFFVPQHQKNQKRASPHARSRSSYLPLFPGYVFFRGSLAERQTALQSRLIVQVLEVQDQALLQKELFELHALKQSGATLLPFEELHSGDRVQVTEGPFQGYSGLVVRGQTRLRLLVSITMLGKSVAVEFDRDVLHALPASGRPFPQTRTAVA